MFAPQPDQARAAIARDDLVNLRSKRLPAAGPSAGVPAHELSPRSSVPRGASPHRAGDSATTPALVDAGPWLEFAVVQQGGRHGRSAPKPCQDAHLLKVTLAGARHVNVFGVCDGHGAHGHLVSRFVAREMGHVLSQVLRREGGRIPMVQQPWTPLASAAEEQAQAHMMAAIMRRAVGRVENALLRAPSIDASLSGTTLVFALLVGQHMTVVNVGDSKCVLGAAPRASPVQASSAQAPEDRGRSRHFPPVGPAAAAAAAAAAPPGTTVRQSGAPSPLSSLLPSGPGPCCVAEPMTIDHKPTLPSEAQRILEAGGEIRPALMPGSGAPVGPPRVFNPSVPGRPGLDMSRSIGDAVGTAVGVISAPVVTYKFLTPQRDRWLVLASDGLWDKVTEDEAVAMCERAEGQWRRARSARALRAHAGAEEPTGAEAAAGLEPAEPAEPADQAQASLCTLAAQELVRTAVARWDRGLPRGAELGQEAAQTEAAAAECVSDPGVPSPLPPRRRITDGDDSPRRDSPRRDEGGDGGGSEGLSLVREAEEEGEEDDEDDLEADAPADDAPGPAIVPADQSSARAASPRCADPPTSAAGAPVLPGPRSLSLSLRAGGETSSPPAGAAPAAATPETGAGPPASVGVAGPPRLAAELSRLGSALPALITAPPAGAAPTRGAPAAPPRIVFSAMPPAEEPEPSATAGAGRDAQAGQGAPARPDPASPVTPPTVVQHGRRGALEAAPDRGGAGAARSGVPGGSPDGALLRSRRASAAAAARDVDGGARATMATPGSPSPGRPRRSEYRDDVTVVVVRLWPAADAPQSAPHREPPGSGRSGSTSISQLGSVRSGDTTSSVGR